MRPRQAAAHVAKPNAKKEKPPDSAFANWSATVVPNSSRLPVLSGGVNGVDVAAILIGEGLAVRFVCGD
jgi:hypothetical protein